MKTRRSTVSILMLAALVVTAHAANRPISQKWDVRNGPTRRMPIQWFAGESVAFDLQPVNGRNAFDLSGATVIWEVTDWNAQTNAYLSATGTVSGATAIWILTPQQGNLPEGTYNGYVRAVTGSDERVVLAWQTVKVLWSPASGNFARVEPSSLVYSASEVDSLLASTSNTLAIAISTNTAAIATHGSRIAGLDLGTNNWNTAFNWGDHAAGGYLQLSDTNNFAPASLTNSVLVDADGVWRASTDQAYVGIGTNRFCI